MPFTDNPYYARALRFIEETDLAALPAGKHVIDGDHLWVNIVDSPMKSAGQARYEVHDRYIDIQVPLSKAETFGVLPRALCTRPDGEMDPVKDILFFDDPVGALVTVEAGQSITFGPDTAHAPLIGEGTIHKAIFKVEAV
ncbi:MAG: YhcH/YjgK/YiaL family protein [Bacteroidales bacterium]|nr:YhcH/YjgK/YiaL family protein [Bacteroidales bacterium]